MIQNLTVAEQWANTVCHKPEQGVLQAWHKAPGDEAILACLYMCIQNTDLHVHTYKHSSTHTWDLPLSKNWSVMPPCSFGPLLLLVSGRPKAFKCFKLIITLMLSLPLWSPCLSVRKWNAIEIDAKMRRGGGLFRHFRGCWGFGVCTGIRRGTESKQAPKDVLCSDRKKLESSDAKKC